VKPNFGLKVPRMQVAPFDTHRAAFINSVKRSKMQY